MSVRRATARLQLHSGFTLSDARQRIAYYASLGVSHLYLSPISKAVPGSTHGYDVVDPGVVNPELGGETALLELSHALRERDMGILLDIVPNHMATHPDNPWWWDVLRNGRKSRFATWFDIDWNSADPALRGKVLAPFLGDDYSDSLARGVIRLEYDGTRRAYVVNAGGAVFPVSDESLDAGRTPDKILAEYDPDSTQGRARLEHLLDRQHYRLCHWQRAADSINWRRFFEISGLIGVRVEDEEVFDAVHALPLKLYQDGVVDGLRIDHVDGLAHPQQYCATLRSRMKARRPSEDEPWVVVEKILAAGENLDARWQVDGTTGYDFMDQVSAVLHDPDGCERLVQLWKSLSANNLSAEEHLLRARSLMLERHFVAERSALVRRMHALVTNRAGEVEWTQADVDRVLRAFLACFPVYRSYIEGRNASQWDEQVIETTAARARRHLDLAAGDHRLLELILAWLRGVPSHAPSRVNGAPKPDECVARAEVVRRFEQLTPPLAAKSLEDTVFYRYAPLLSRNEVGSEPTVLAESAEQFHARNGHRGARHPAALLATASHDHKRGPDSRMRLAVLSERAGDWARVCGQWQDWSASASNTVVQPGDAYMLWQALVGAWPLELELDDPDAMADFGRRIAQWQRKALREAKVNSSWFEPNLAYEAACACHVFSALGWDTASARQMAEHMDAESGAASQGYAPTRGIVRSLHAFVQEIAAAGAVNSLSQLTLHLTSPGVPDIYQGSEFWDFSLVDPDNRRPVDYEARIHALNDLALTNKPALLQRWRDGRIKQSILRSLLALRYEHTLLFSEGSYEPLQLNGPRARNVLAFARCWADQLLIVVAPRLCAETVPGGPGSLPRVDMTYWGDTGIMVGAHRVAAVKDVFTGREFYPSGDATLRVEQLLSELPCAVLTAA